MEFIARFPSRQQAQFFCKEADDLGRVYLSPRKSVVTYEEHGGDNRQEHAVRAKELALKLGATIHESQSYGALG